ncbi:phage tail protein [Acinetobacter sp. YH16031]|uniref:phage tail protein n=1 Tax=Acinetobacter sp. YH16031 TaxID=2601180 RepID=UPI0015D1BF2A|nr:phage tail protein [Acinetobacter sp. YH16031]
MGKSSSQVVGYRYYAKFAAFIGNRIEKLIAINFDNRKWLTRRPGESEPNLAVYAPNLYGENEGGVNGLIDVFIGYPNQQPSEVYQQYFPLVSGYPYQSYLVFHGGSDNKGFYLGNSGYMKEMLLWVKRTRVRNDGREQWYEVRGDGAVVCEIGAFEREGQGLKPTNAKHIDISFNVNWSYSPGERRSDGFQQALDRVYTEDDSFGNNQISYAPGTEYGFSESDNPLLFNAEVVFGDCEGGIVAIFEAEFGNVGGRPFIPGLFSASFSADNVRSEIIPGTRTVRWYVDIKNKRSVSANITGNLFPEQNSSGYFFNHSASFVGFYQYEIIPNNGATGSDINPIHKIREILTDDTAMGKPESDVNNVNFMKAADRIYDEGLGISWAIDEKSCIEAIEELCYHIEAGIRVNRQTGLYEVVLFRDDWLEENEIHDIAENRIKDLSLEVMNSDDIVNQLNVTYYDRERIKNSTFSVYENGSILTMGHANAESVEFPYFMNMRNAEIVANWKLKQFSTPAWSGSFTTGWKEARKWNRYDLIRLPWSSKWNGTILVRIMKINLGNGADNTVTIDFEEVIPYSGEMNTSIVVDAPVESAPQPPQPSMNAVFEAPYYLTVLRAGQTNADLELSNNPDIGYVAAIAAKPQSNSLNALLYTDGGVGEFEQVSRLDYCDILQLDQPIIETTSAFTVAGSLTQTANSNNLILLNNELMGFVSFDDETKVLTVKRGVLDTVPKKHSGGSLFVFDLPDVAFDSTQYADGEVVEAQVLTTTPSGLQDLLETGQSIEIKSRAIRPYPPANVKINGEYWPEEIETDLIITWSDRNRIQQTGGTPLGWFDSSVNIEPNTQTHLILSQLDENQIELATSNANVTGVNTFNFSIASMQPDARTVELTLKTVRDGYECLNPFVHTVELSQFFSAPYDLTVEFKND